MIHLGIDLEVENRIVEAAPARILSKKQIDGCDFSNVLVVRFTSREKAMQSGAHS